MADAHANFAASVVVTPPSPALSGTSLTVLPGQGARFPAVPFNATATATGTGIMQWRQIEPTCTEIVRVTGISTDTLTIVRAQEGSSALAIDTQWIIDASTPTAKAFTDLAPAVIPVPSQKTVDYTLGLGDANNLIRTFKSTAINLTIPANSSVAFPVGTIVYFANTGTGTMTLGITTDTLTGPTTYVTGKGGYLIKTAATVWIAFAAQ